MQKTKTTKYVCNICDGTGTVTFRSYAPFTCQLCKGTGILEEDKN